MFDEIELGGEFFEGLLAIDAAITARVALAGCGFCGGPLHRGDFDRKPRGGLIGVAGERFCRRFSLCCGRDGCRRRATPPSVRFLGRRVYLGAVVILASVAAISVAAVAARAARRAVGVAARTTRRWVRWWRGPFPVTPVFVELAARIIGLDRQRLPTSIIEATLGAPDVRVLRLLRRLAPLTTQSVPDGSRFLRGIG